MLVKIVGVIIATFVIASVEPLRPFTIPFAIVALVTVFVIEGVRVVPQQSAWIVERLGKFNGVLVWQSLVSAIVAVVGVAWVHQYRKRTVANPMQGLDVGQPAAFDSWVNQGAGHARVRYRDALWDAQVAGGASVEPGEVLYVTSVDGNTLKVSKTRPA